MTDKIEELAKEQVAEFLPRAIEKTLDSYHAFMGEDVDDKRTKKFKEHQMACRVAIAHIDLLLKLARWAEMPVGTSGEAVADLSKIVHLATGDAQQHKDDYPEDEVDDLA